MLHGTMHWLCARCLEDMLAPSRRPLRCHMCREELDEEKLRGLLRCGDCGPKTMEQGMQRGVSPTARGRGRGRGRGRLGTGIVYGEPRNIEF